MKYARLPAVICSLVATSALAQTGQITVDLDHPAHAVSPTFYGLMTEEINHSYDGGLYAELVQNRDLKDKPDLAHWSAVGNGKAALDNDSPVPGTALTSSIRLEATSAGDGVANDGYWGVPAIPDTNYKVGLYAKAAAGYSGPLTLTIESADGSTEFAKAETKPLTGGWSRYELVLKTGACQVSASNRFVIRTTGAGTVWLTQVSLMPPTFHGRENGNRIDLTQMLGEMRPTFLRLPGGNYLEGDTVAERFNWKATIHDISQRPGHQGPWGYRSSDGLGLLEFLEWCEDLHMQPVLGVYDGLSFREEVQAGTDLQPYVQDALDEIEYVTGDTDTKWGRVRAQDGHPKPFPLTYVEIGNEDGTPTYEKRFAQFYDAIRSSYPRLKIIATSPVRTRRPDVLDDHYYRDAASMERDSTHYDNYSRTGAKIFVGEWASTEGNPTPTLQAALGDAAWLTGLERNSNLVVMEAYAPLLVNVNPGAAQWGTNLIGYDALHSFGSPSYWVQSLFAKNTGQYVLPTTLSMNGSGHTAVDPTGRIGIGTYQTQSEFKDIMVSCDGVPLKGEAADALASWTVGAGTWSEVGGALRQTSDERDARATEGEPSWKDYTLDLKARKLSGREGFLIQFHYKDDGNFWQWNVGGWGNQTTALQASVNGSTNVVGKGVSLGVETGRWYDVRVVLQGGSIKCYLDGKLVNELSADQVQAALSPSGPLYVAASGDGRTVYLKVVNVSGNAIPLTVNLKGGGLSFRASGWVITGSPSDVNSLAQPEKVAPKAISIEGAGPKFQQVFPAYSVTVIWLSSKPH